MDSMNSFNGNGKVDEVEQQAFKKKTRKRLIILAVSSIVLVAIIIAAVAGTAQQTSSSADKSAPASSLRAVCNVTQYPNSCFSSISSLPNTNTMDPTHLFNLSLRVATNALSNLSPYLSNLQRNASDSRLQKAIHVCEMLLQDAISRFNDSISSLVGAQDLLPATKVNDIQTWLSAAITDQDTCLDALQELNSSDANAILYDLKTDMKNSTEFASNSLAIVTKILGLLSNFNATVHRRLLGGFPEWMDRRLLQESHVTADAVVAKDGSGQYSTITEAVEAVEKRSEKRFVIYVKEGTYEENIDLDADTWNVMIYGDGKSKTIISGSRNFVDGTPTFQTATFGVKGRGFIGKDIGFVNSAGAEKQQGVAMLSASDRSVFYRCSFDGFQDTLYAHSNRQFYRECDITGTIDFIFGNAAVVLQNCNIMPRQPLANQFNTITAQGKTDPNQNTAIVIHKSSISALHDLQSPTYLGRPWKDYSTTVIMHSDIASFVNPAGWTSCYPNEDPPNTILYAEYQNTGPGSDTSQRVKWPGYKPALTEEEAGTFTVQSFIQGPEWLPDAAVQFEPTL
ncbi:pectinesterase 3-like [Abrus precatorius]|uniref:Pectinesterase n=1 Tax=Abrus precatorius TaxID=3816 RepID=A0A8B8LAQ7_ABRPR|nr:pectinesterase 3-like [Abrus precatorius]